MKSKILIVGYRPEESLNYRSYLNSKGYEVISGLEESEPIKMLFELKLDLVLIDIAFDYKIDKLNLFDQIHNNELVVNSIKYAFLDRKYGKIMVKLKHRNGEFNLTVGDNGGVCQKI